MTAVAHDEAARFVYTLVGPHRNYLTKEDLVPILKDLIETFPGLHFLREAEEFHSRYVETVSLLSINPAFIINFRTEISDFGKNLKINNWNNLS